jgi:hypothetical protein
MAKVYYERHALAAALGTSLNATGWGIGQVREGFQSQEEIEPPMVSVYFLPSRYLEIQMGRSITQDKSFERRIQIDCYMETEPRAMTIADDVADFIDEMFINITDPEGTIIGHLYCPNSESILIETINPKATELKLLRWRSVIQATLQSNYDI